jgi:hypothetical protein
VPQEWDATDPHFARTLSRRRTPVVLVGAPATQRWPAFDRWATPGYLERQVPHPIKFAK